MGMFLLFNCALTDCKFNITSRFLNDNKNPSMFLSSTLATITFNAEINMTFFRKNRTESSKILFEKMMSFVGSIS